MWINSQQIRKSSITRERQRSHLRVLKSRLSRRFQDNVIAAQHRPRTLPTESCIQRLPGVRTGMGISVVDLPMPRGLRGSRRIVKIDRNSKLPQLSCARANVTRRTPHTHGFRIHFAGAQPKEHRDTAPRGNRSRAAKRAVQQAEDFIHPRARVGTTRGRVVGLQDPLYLSLAEYSVTE